MKNKREQKISNSQKKIKISSKNTKNNTKNIIFNQIFKDFCNWLVGICEDTPIPIETKNIYFIVEFVQGDIVISFSADDKNLLYFDYGTFFPLEAEYFFSSNLNLLAINLFIKKSISKTQVLNMLKELILKAKSQLDVLSSKNIFFGERFAKIYSNNCL